MKSSVISNAGRDSTTSTAYRSDYPLQFIQSTQFLQLYNSKKSIAKKKLSEHLRFLTLTKHKQIIREICQRAIQQMERLFYI